MDFDLDSLLSDLTSFDPTSVVAKSHPPPPPQQRSDPAPQPVVADTPPHMRTPERRGNSSARSTPQHQPSQQGFVEPSPTPPSTPGTTPSHGPARSQTQVDRNYQPKRDMGPEVILRSHTQAVSPEHKRPAGTLMSGGEIVSQRHDCVSVGFVYP